MEFFINPSTVNDVWTDELPTGHASQESINWEALELYFDPEFWLMIGIINGRDNAQSYAYMLWLVEWKWG